MTNLERVLSLAVHEFRTPMTVVGGYLRMVLGEQAGQLNDKQRKMLEEAERSCGRVTALVAEMSDLSKLEGHALALARGTVDFGPLVQEVASRMHEGEDRGVRLEVRGADQPAVVTGDRPRLSAALSALMHAALRERGEPGVVMAEWSMIEEAGATWVLVAIGEAAVIPLLVAARHAPPPFDEWRPGLGLALPVARRIIEAHDGALWSADGSPSRAASALRLPVRG